MANPQRAHSDPVAQTDDAEVDEAVLDAADRREAIAWWTLFFGPVAIGVAVLIAGVHGDRRTVILVFSVAVFVYSLTLSAGARSASTDSHWIWSVFLSFACGALAFMLLWGANEISVSNPISATTPPESPGTTNLGGSTPPAASIEPAPTVTQPALADPSSTNVANTSSPSSVAVGATTTTDS